MGGQIQLLQLPLGEAVVEGDAQGLGGLGRVLGDVAGDLLGAQLLVVAGLGDVADVELLAQRASRVTPRSSRSGQGTATVAAAWRTA
jgi:hypothetical protein